MKCYVLDRGLASVLSEAVATAQTDACSTGGSATAIAEAIASQVKTAVAQAFALATAESCGGVYEEITIYFIFILCCSVLTCQNESLLNCVVVANQGSNASASSKCTGSASSSGSESLGDRCAGIILKEDCAGRAASVCCDPSYKSAFCACPGYVPKIVLPMRSHLNFINGHCP